MCLVTPPLLLVLGPVWAPCQILPRLPKLRAPVTSLSCPLLTLPLVPARVLVVPLVN